MDIHDTISTLEKIRRSIEKGVPSKVANPDAAVAYLNSLYTRFSKNPDFNELFDYDDVGSPSITLTISIDAEFDLESVVKSMREKLREPQAEKMDAIGTAGVVWSHGRYDFVYDAYTETLMISHKYSHEQVDTQSVWSILETMIDHAKLYLEQVDTSAHMD